MSEIKTDISVGRYHFRIIDSSQCNREGEIYSRNFKIGGTYHDCVNVSITYNEDSRPISAKIPTLVYVPECSFDIPLDRGEGSIVISKTLLRYIHKQLPTINEFVFDDMSNIECGTEDEIRQKKFRKTGTNAVPVVLYYFSIACNGVTWYEKHFNAYQKDRGIHAEYRKRVEWLLKDKDAKSSFNDFLRIAKPPQKNVEELELFYEKSETYGEFFNSIPKDERCRLVREWIGTFMEHYLNGYFFNTNWVIDVTHMDPLKKINQKAGTRKKSKISHTSSYYCPVGRIHLSKTLYDTGA